MAPNIRFIKGSHFAIGVDQSEKGAAHFVTLKERSYKPCDVVEKAALNAGKLTDLRKSHFEIGNEKEPIYTRNQEFYTNKTKDMPARKPKEINLRGSHFSLGDGSTDFVSNNMLQYRNPALP